jgi:hypothetical protein
MDTKYGSAREKVGKGGRVDFVSYLALLCKSLALFVDNTDIRYEEKLHRPISC